MAKAYEKNVILEGMRRQQGKGRNVSLARESCRRRANDQLEKLNDGKIQSICPCVTIYNDLFDFRFVICKEKAGDGKAREG